MNKMVRSHFLCYAISNRQVKFKFGGTEVELYIGDHTPTALRLLRKDY